METGAQGEEFRKLPFRDLRLKYTELSGLECRSKNREWIVGKCVQMKLYGTHEALGKRTLKAAVVGREVNLTLSNNTLLNEEGEESMYHYNPKHVKTIINNQYNNATAEEEEEEEEEEAWCISRKICSTETEKI